MIAAGALYFAIVFAAAFALGTVRTFFLEPALGETIAVAIEIPFLIVVMVFAARLVLRRFSAVRGGAPLLCIGLVGLALQQSAEIGLVLLSGETIASHLAYFSTLAGRLYLSALVVFVLAPFVIGRSAKK